MTDLFNVKNTSVLFTQFYQSTTVLLNGHFVTNTRQ